MKAILISHNFIGFKEFLFIDKANAYHGPQYHDFFEIQVYLKPVGKMQVNNTDYDIRRGDIVLINMFEPHCLLDHTLVDEDRFCIVIDADFFLNVCTIGTNLLNLFSEENYNHPVKRINDIDLNILVNIIKRYRAIVQEPGSDLLERAVLYEFLAKLYRMFYDKTTEEKIAKSTIPQILMIIKYINANLEKPLTLDELAAEVHFSKYYLCRQFKKYTNFTLNQYIISKRIHKAKLLLVSNLPIKQVSSMVGFNYYSQFYKTFKRLEKISPSEYYKKHILTEQNQ